MREIKFRVWHRGNMINLVPPSFDGQDLVSEEDWIVMQFTGLKDKNGVEIYENDVIQDDYGYNYKVEFIEGRFMPLVQVKEGYNCIDRYDERNFEVIGNIYENPELLTNQS